jgi:hypothetical protein
MSDWWLEKSETPAVTQDGKFVQRETLGGLRGATAVSLPSRR